MKRVGLIALVVLGLVSLTAVMGVTWSPKGPVVAVEQAVAAADPLKAAGGPVCIAIPVLASTAGNRGNCGPGQVEVSNDPNSGGAIIVYLKWILKLLNGLIGGIILLVLVVSGIQYIVSAGDPSRVKEAKGRIVHAITALVLYLLMFAILNFIVPGGILT